MPKRKFRISKWIILALAIACNSFIIFYSCLDAKTTDDWTSSFTNIFSTIINSFTKKDVEVIPITSLDAFLSSDTYNNIPGYEFEEIPLGSAKQITCSMLPDTATDKAVTYYTEQNDIVLLNQSGSTVSVVGLKTGIATIYAKNTTSGLSSSVDIKVVDIVEPQNFDISVDNQTINDVTTLNFDIDGGVLGHDELINSRYYDITKLNYQLSDESILTIDKNGVIYPKKIGLASVTVSNSVGVSKEIEITVSGVNTHDMYSDLMIKGSNTCYANDMILDQNSHKNHYQLEIYDNDTLLDNNDFIWESSNNLLAKVDKYGVVRGFRKQSNDDEYVIIKAASKHTSQVVVFEMVVKNQLPTSMYYWFEIGDHNIWNATEYTVCVGDNIKVNLGYDPNTQTKDVVIESSDIALIDYTNQGSSFTLHIKSEGTCTINFVSVINPELSGTTKFTILKAGAISTESMGDVGYSLRKSIGHASFFGVTQIFTFIAFYMFMYDKKPLIYTSLSVGSGLLLSIISEIIQHFVPTRTGAFLDVLIDFSGVVVGAVLVIITLLIIRKIRSKNDSPSTMDNL